MAKRVGRASSATKKTQSRVQARRVSAQPTPFRPANSSRVRRSIAQTSRRTQRSQRGATKRFFKQLVGYSISGGARFWSGYGAFFVFDRIVGLHLWWAKQLSNLLGLAVEFTLDRLFVFTGRKQKHEASQVSGRFLVITVVNFLIDFCIIFGLKKIGISPYIGQFISAAFFWGWNFMWYRFWVFTGSGSRSG